MEKSIKNKRKEENRREIEKIGHGSCWLEVVHWGGRLGLIIIIFFIWMCLFGGCEFCLNECFGLVFLRYVYFFVLFFFFFFVFMRMPFLFFRYFCVWFLKYMFIVCLNYLSVFMTLDIYVSVEDFLNFDFFSFFPEKLNWNANAGSLMLDFLSFQVRALVMA